MADVQHSTLTDPQLHEPKGASTASIDTVYVADGSGSGVWTKVGADQIDQTTTNAYIQADLDDGTLDVNGKWYQTAVIDDVSTSSSILVPVLRSGTLARVRCVLNGGITTADAVLTFTRNDGASLGSTLTIVESGSTEGTGFTFTATTNQAVTSPGYIKIATNGASDTAQKLFLTLEFDGVLND